MPTSSTMNSACLPAGYSEVTCTLMAAYVSRVAALKYALPTIAVLQLASIWVARDTLSSVARVTIEPARNHAEIVEVVTRFE